MVDYGVKIGPDTSTDTDLELDFTSGLGTLKVYKWGTTTITPDASGNGTSDIVHDLDYAPCILVFVKNSSNEWYQIGGASDLFLGDATSGIFAFSDADKLRIQTIGGDSKLAQVERTFKYYILIDKAQEFSSASGISLTNDYGMKVSEAGSSVLTAEEYKMAFSSKYKSLQYFEESIKEETLTLPAMWTSYVSQSLDEEQHVDFTHGLGYAPLFFCWFKTGSVLKEATYNEFDSTLVGIDQSYYTDYEVSAICDTTKIRVKFKRVSEFDLGNFEGENDSSGFSPGLLSTNKHAAQTITVRVLPFAEDLGGS